MQSFRKYLGRQLPPLGKVIRVDSIKIANEVRGHAGTRRCLQTNRLSAF